jgi:carbamoyl-phosphate synthase small subunit
MSPAYLALEDGRVVEARTRVPGRTRGELVFTTAYTGYEESLTDPSYEEQVLTFSYPLIGNYGVRAERFESDRVHPRAAVAHEFTEDVVDWLADEGVPAVDHLDTRELVTSIREGGAMRCGVAAGEDATPDDARAELDACVPMSAHDDIGAQVSVAEAETHDPDGDSVADVALVDCGAKGSIRRSLLERGATVHVLPHDVDAATVESLGADVVFVSNGPGDPETFEAAESLVEEFAGERPVAGICLGQQVVANALGGSTSKMEFGHRGVNQPVRDLDSGRVVMTTQNHGYTVDEPGDALDVTQVNVNDDTAEGLASTDLGVITRQYHPEANPGPHDSLDFFDDVLALARGDDPL